MWCDLRGARSRGETAGTSPYDEDVCRRLRHLNGIFKDRRGERGRMRVRWRGVMYNLLQIESTD